MGNCCSGNDISCNCAAPVKKTEVSTKLTTKDVIGAWKARWNIGRMSYKVEPGLYYVGVPDKNSPVLVTANYKMSFDVLRKQLEGISAWIIVLDTKEINVWCAAGKGTFGTEELIKKIEETDISQVVEHKNLILPQLGAVGVSAHEVQRRTGFKVIYGPIRAEDVPVYLNNGMKADKEMRTVKFGFIDRVVLTPVEIVAAIKPSLMIFGIMFLLNLIGFTKFTAMEVYSYIGAIFCGTFLAPAMLPWIPTRPFSVKGWLLGVIWTCMIIYFNGFLVNDEIIKSIAYFMILPSVSAYLALNFTGCSTYTSYSGVVKEMKIAIPFIIITISLGVVLLFVEYLRSAI